MQKAKEVKQGKTVGLGGAAKAKNKRPGKDGKIKMNKPIGGLTTGQMTGGDEADETKKVPPRAKQKDKGGY